MVSRCMGWNGTENFTDSKAPNFMIETCSGVNLRTQVAYDKSR